MPILANADVLSSDTVDELGGYCRGSSLKSMSYRQGRAKYVAPLRSLDVILVGIDISSHQQDIDWVKVSDNDRINFTYIKVSEGNCYDRSNKDFDNPLSQYNDSADNGLLRGMYHYANPGITDFDTNGNIVYSSGVDQANYMLDSFGCLVGEDNNTFRDGKTLPPVLDIEDNIYQGDDGFIDKCYTRTPDELITWIKEFLDTTEQLIGIRPIIYSTQYFWNNCMGGTDIFSQVGENNTKLWVASWGIDSLNSSNMFGGWAAEDVTFWQFTSSAVIDEIGVLVDFNGFNGTKRRAAKIGSTKNRF